MHPLSYPILFVFCCVCPFVRFMYSYYFLGFKFFISRVELQRREQLKTSALLSDPGQAPSSRVFLLLDNQVQLEAELFLPLTGILFLEMHQMELAFLSTERMCLSLTLIRNVYPTRFRSGRNLDELNTKASVCFSKAWLSLRQCSVDFIYAAWGGARRERRKELFPS